jgi:hypothetical protein
MSNDFEKLYTDAILENHELRAEKMEYHKRWRSGVGELMQIRKKMNSGQALNANIEISKKISKAENDLVRQLNIFKKFFGKISKVNDPKEAVKYFRNAAAAVAEEDLETIKRMGRNLSVVGHCEVCSISVYGHRKKAAPIETSMPCGIKNCAYDDDRPGKLKSFDINPDDIRKSFKVV